MTLAEGQRDRLAPPRTKRRGKRGTKRAARRPARAKVKSHAGREPTQAISTRKSC